MVDVENTEIVMISVTGLLDLIIIGKFIFLISVLTVGNDFYICINNFYSRGRGSYRARGRGSFYRQDRGHPMHSQQQHHQHSQSSDLYYNQSSTNPSSSVQSSSLQSGNVYHDVPYHELQANRYEKFCNLIIKICPIVYYLFKILKYQLRYL